MSSGHDRIVTRDFNRYLRHIYADKSMYAIDAVKFATAIVQKMPSNRQQF